VLVVAISGSGRTGSTLLSLLLTQAPGTFNLGQSRSLWSAWAEDAPCTCGHGLRSCPVLGRLVPDILAALGTDAEALNRASLRFIADAERVADWSDAGARQGLAVRHRLFIAAIEALLAGLAGMGWRSFVDSSKVPEMALAFDLAAGGGLRLVNLMRDPRAVAVSWYRRKGSLPNVIRTSRKWATRQRRLERYAAALGERAAVLRYEELAAAPRQSLGRLAVALGLDDPAGTFTGPETVDLDWTNQHLYPPANEKVLAERRTSVRIRPAEDWRAPEYRWLHRLAMLASWPEGARHYPAPP